MLSHQNWCLVMATLDKKNMVSKKLHLSFAFFENKMNYTQKIRNVSNQF